MAGGSGKHFEGWANVQEAVESALIQDDAVAGRRVGQGPVEPCPSRSLPNLSAFETLSTAG